MGTENPRELMTIKLQQAKAMLLAISGPGLNSFEELFDNDKDSYLCAVLDSIDEALKASKQI